MEEKKPTIASIAEAFDMLGNAADQATKALRSGDREEKEEAKALIAMLGIGHMTFSPRLKVAMLLMQDEIEHKAAERRAAVERNYES